MKLNIIYEISTYIYARRGSKTLEKRNVIIHRFSFRKIKMFASYALSNGIPVLEGRRCGYK
jgi:hypothetical protein